MPVEQCDLFRAYTWGNLEELSTAARKKPEAISRRQYPRAPVRIKARLSIPGEKGARFEATLNTSDLSVGGIFFESTFFLRTGQVLDVELRLPSTQRDVRARGQIVRVEQLVKGKERSGFAVKFTEYLDGSEVVLANYFLAPALRAFVKDYVKQQRVKAADEYIEHMVDVLAAWELRKVNGEDPELWSDKPTSNPRR